MSSLVADPVTWSSEGDCNTRISDGGLSLFITLTEYNEQAAQKVGFEWGHKIGDPSGSFHSLYEGVENRYSDTFTCQKIDCDYPAPKPQVGLTSTLSDSTFKLLLKDHRVLFDLSKVKVKGQSQGLIITLYSQTSAKFHPRYEYLKRG